MTATIEGYAVRNAYFDGQNLVAYTDAATYKWIEERGGWVRDEYITHVELPPEALAEAMRIVQAARGAVKGDFGTYRREPPLALDENRMREIKQEVYNKTGGKV